MNNSIQSRFSLLYYPEFLYAIILENDGVLPDRKKNFFSNGPAASSISTKVFHSRTKKKHVNRHSDIAFSPISQSSFFEEVCCSILAPSQRKLRGSIKFLKFDITIKKLKNPNSSKI